LTKQPWVAELLDNGMKPNRAGKRTMRGQSPAERADRSYGGSSPRGTWRTLLSGARGRTGEWCSPGEGAPATAAHQPNSPPSQGRLSRPDSSAAPLRTLRTPPQRAERRAGGGHALRGLGRSRLRRGGRTFSNGRGRVADGQVTIVISQSPRRIQRDCSRTIRHRNVEPTWKSTGVESLSGRMLPLPM
jgi:hypothetical protein